MQPLGMVHTAPAAAKDYSIHVAGITAFQGLLRERIFRLRVRRAGQWGAAYLYGLGSVGERVRMSGRVYFGDEPYLIHLGSDVTLTDQVYFVTHDGGTAVVRARHPDLNVFGEIRV